jgi:hypothetical protein
VRSVARDTVMRSCGARHVPGGGSSQRDGALDERPVGEI